MKCTIPTVTYRIQWPRTLQKSENFEGTVKPVELEPRSNGSLLVSENSSSPKNI
jgi:hypothetical protein